ncbi:MAG: cell division protein FtsZ [Flavobacteriales bacterium]|nr:cell division protein FtsZ [Flavobacteriales bacterium]
MEFDLPKDQSSIIKVIGVGGGGSNAVNHMYNQGITGVDFVICNTDQQALDMSPVPNKMQLGSTLTEGRGAGSNPEVGKNAAIENVDDLKALLEKNTQMVFITAGMGGGTGTGAAPIIAKTAREMGILTVGIVTIPFSFEGRRRKLQADEGLSALRDNVDTLLVICNDKLREMHGNLKISEAFSKADDILTVAAKGIAEIITVAGYINVDFEDVKTVMKDGGTAIMGSAAAEGDSRAVKAVSSALASPLLNDNDITGANYILLNITSGEEEVSMDEIDEITDYIQNEAGNTADIIWGNGVDESLGNKISVTIIATGFGAQEPSGFQMEKKPKKVVRDLNDEVKTEITQSPEGEQETKSEEQEDVNPQEPYLKTKDETESENQASFEFEIRPSIPQDKDLEKDPPQVKRFNLDDELNKDDESEDVPSDEEIKMQSREDHQPERQMDEEEQIKKSQDRILKLKALSLKMKSPGGINDLEQEPAYKRRNIKLEDTPHSSESNVSRYTLGEDEEKKTTLKQNNSFLHDNVD